MRCYNVQGLDKVSLKKSMRNVSTGKYVDRSSQNWLYFDSMTRSLIIAG